MGARVQLVVEEEELDHPTEMSACESEIFQL